VWWLVESTELGYTGVSEHLGVSRPRVSQIITKFKRLSETEEAAAGWRSTLEATLYDS